MEKQSFQLFLETPLGPVEIKSTEREVFSVQFREKMQASNQSLPLVLRECAIQLDEYFQGKRKEFTVPLRIEGTAFQKSVWKLLGDIPYATTSSYGQLSKLLNNPGAIRAVGAANGKNRLLILVPCHRIIGSDGKLTGYAGGLKRKQGLLEHEAKVEGTSQMLF